MCISSNSVNQAQDLISVTKFEDFPNSLLPSIGAVNDIVLTPSMAHYCLSHINGELWKCYPIQHKDSHKFRYPGVKCPDPSD